MFIIRLQAKGVLKTLSNIEDGAFCIKDNKSNLLTIFAKSSNLTISQGCEYASAFQHKKRQIRKTSGKIFTSKCMKILKTLKKKFILEKGKCLFSVKMHDLDLK